MEKKNLKTKKLLAYEIPMVDIITLNGMNLLSGSDPEAGMAKPNNLYGYDEAKSEDE